MSGGGSPAVDSASASDLLKLLSTQMTSLTSTVEKQHLRLRIVQGALDKAKAEAADATDKLRDREAAVVKANQLMTDAMQRAQDAQNRAQQANAGAAK